MAYIVKQKVYGKDYFYLRKSFRIGKKVTSKCIAYLGKNREEAEERAKLFIEKMEKENKIEKTEEKKEHKFEENNFDSKKEQNDFRKSLMAYVYEKGFIFGPSPEIYGGVAGFFDFGPVGKTLKNNIENHIRKTFNKFQFFEVECPIVTPKVVWEASGHLSGFSDPLVKCTKCSSIWRADNLVSEQFDKDADSFTFDELKEFLKKNKVLCPNCKTTLSDDLKKHNLMLKTQVGLDIEMYNRPETATTTYLPFLNYVKFFREKLPFGVFQIGNAYRNEISPRQHVIRGREFTQAEAQIFLFKDQKDNFPRFNEIENTVLPLFSAGAQKENKGIVKMSLKDAIEKKLLKNKAYAWSLGMTYLLFKELGLPEENLRYKQHLPEKLAFYADDAWDLEVKFNSFGWIECCGVHDRTDYDLTTHAKFSGKELVAQNLLTNKKEVPHVLEIAMGPNRMLLAILDNFYDKRGVEEGKSKLALPIKIAPVKVAIFPLMKKDKMPELAKKIFDNLSESFLVVSDESGSIGKRYLRQDEIGTPFCITVDFDSITNNDVTIRERDSEKQIRVKIENLNQVITDLLNKEINFEKAGKLVK